MAYRTSVHESTGYTPHFLVYGQEVCLPIDLMYPNPSDQPPVDIHELVSARQISKGVRFGSYSPEFQSATQERHLQSTGPRTHLPS